MKKNKFYSTMYTAIVNMINSSVSIILGLVFSKLILLNYGSEVNGFVATIIQFVSFFSVLEGGLTTAAIVSIYRPLLDKSYKEANDILYTAKIKYLKIGFWIVGCVLILGVVYLLNINISLSFMTCLILIIICVFQTFCSIALESKYNIVLFGTNMEYMSTLLKLVARLIGWIFSIIFILKGYNIILVYSTYIITSVLNIVLIRQYERKLYKEINYKGKYSPDKINGTNDLMFQKIASTIFNSTDMFLISIILNFSVASVYNVYNLIYRSITQILRSVFQAPFNSLGQLLNAKSRNLNEIRKLSTYYNTLVLYLTTFILIVAALCTLPFVRLFTIGIVDINYISIPLVYLFFSTTYFQLINQSYASIINASGLFKLQNKICMISAITNIILSIILGNIYGVSGILLGTVIPYVSIMLYNIYICNRKILNTGILKNLIIIFLNYFISIAIIYFGIRIIKFNGGYTMLVFYALIISVLAFIIVLIFNFIFDRKNLISTVKYINSRISFGKRR